MSLHPTYQTIVAGTDFTPLSRVALKAASELGGLLGAKQLKIVHVRSRSELYGAPRYPVGLPPAILAQAEREAIRDGLAHLERIELTKTSAEVLREVRIGGVAEQLLAAADEVKADLIVIATHGRSAVGRLLLGSVASSVIRTASCPIFVVGAERAALTRFKRVLAAVDLSSVSSAVLAHAAEFAALSGATLEVVSIFEYPVMIAGEGMVPMAPVPDAYLLDPAEHRRALEEIVAKAELPAGVEVQIQLERGFPSSAILERADREQADLIVIGTSGHNILQRAMIGSTATKVVARAGCPVLVIPQPLHD